MQNIVEDLTCYYIEEEGSSVNSLDQRPYIAIVKGETFSGKTAFISHLFDELHSVPYWQPYLKANREKLPIFVSQINVENKL